MLIVSHLTVLKHDLQSDKSTLGRVLRGDYRVVYVTPEFIDINSDSIKVPFGFYAPPFCLPFSLFVSHFSIPLF